MSTEYKPKVAIVGLTGALGTGLIKALRANGSRLTLPIHAMGRDTSNQTSDETVQYFSTGDLSDEQLISKALKGVDVIVDASGFVPKQVLAKVAGQEQVKVVFLGHPGCNIFSSQYKTVGDAIVETPLWEKAGIKTVGQTVGWFSKYFLDHRHIMGFDLENGTIDLNGTGDEKVTWTFEDDIGKVVAELVTWTPERLPSQFFYGGQVTTYNEFISMLEHKLGKKLKVNYKPAQQALEEGAKQVLSKDASQINGEDFGTMLRTFHLETGVTFYDDKYMNEVINPSESVFKWTPLEEVIDKYLKV